MIKEIEHLDTGGVTFHFSDNIRITLAAQETAQLKAALVAPWAFKFAVGDKVKKVKGYTFPGVIVAAFPTSAGTERYVVECVTPAVSGVLHIFGPDDLALRDGVNDV